MTEEEFKALLKLKGEKLTLVIEPQVVWTAMLEGGEFNAISQGRWASSTDKETALEMLAKKYFGE